MTSFTLGEIVLYFLRLGTFGFGGPIALVGYMQRDLVETRRWFDLKEYKEGLALAQLAPGPLAAQLAIYLGWLRHGVLGATLVAVAFVLPSFLMVMALSAAYVAYGGIDWMQGAFYGIGAAVIAIIARSAFKLTKGTLGGDRLLWVLFTASAVVTAWTESEVIWLFLLCGVVMLLAGTRTRAVPVRATTLAVLPLWLVTGLAGPASRDILWKIGTRFAEAGAFVFGSGLAIVPFLHGTVVNQLGWLTERQFLDAVAVAMITPGPVVITVAFIGYLVAGPLGGTVAAFGVFLPCYLLVVIPARYFRRAVHDPRVKAFVDGVTAAAAGAIAGAAFVLGRHAIHDVPTALIALATLVALPRITSSAEPLLIVGAGVAGIILTTS
ncbi:MAG TPA: chromate transporter [Candidatus Binatia bacterium]|jgi:chromate transporter